MSISSNYTEEAIVGRESLFRRKLTQLRTTGEIKRVSANHNQTGFKDIEQCIYLNNLNSSWVHGDPRQIEKIALLDSITELYNHDTINRMLKIEVKRALRYKKELALLVITLDCLTRVAKYGSPDSCDIVLKKAAQSLMQTIRDVDIPGRYDREHFLVICPETTAAGAVCLAERLCHQIASQESHDVNQNWHITLSIGIAAFPLPAQNDQQILHLAFNALSVALQSGGNRVSLAQ